MDIDLKEITVREVANGYLDSDEEGVVGYGSLPIGIAIGSFVRDRSDPKNG